MKNINNKIGFIAITAALALTGCSTTNQAGKIGQQVVAVTGAVAGIAPSVVQDAETGISTISAALTPTNAVSVTTSGVVVKP